MGWWVVVFVMFCFERVFLRDCVDCLLWLFLWLILRLIDEMAFRVCLLCFVFWVLLIEWLRGLFVVIVWCDWLFRLVVFYWTVVILWEIRKIKVWRCIARLLLLTLRKNECALIQTVDLLIWACIVCCENAFVFWTSFCERYKSNRLTNRNGYYSCIEEESSGLFSIVFTVWIS